MLIFKKFIAAFSSFMDSTGLGGLGGLRGLGGLGSLRGLTWLAVCSAFLLPSLALAQRPIESKLPIQVTDLVKLAKISALELHSPSGQLLFTVRRIVADTAKKGDYRYQDEVFKLDLKKDRQPEHLYPSLGLDISAVKFSPSGQEWAFVQQVNGKPQLFVQASSGGQAGAITSFKYGANNPLWSADGKALIFSASVDLTDILIDTLLQNVGEPYPTWASEKPGVSWENFLASANSSPNPDGSISEIRAYLQGNAARKKAKVIDKLQFQTESYTTGDLKFNHYFMVKLDNPDVIVPLARGYRSYANAYVDGADGIFFTVREGTVHPDRNQTNALYRLNLKSNLWERLLFDGEHQFTLIEVDTLHKQLAYTKQKPNTLTTAQLFIADYGATLQNTTLIALDLPKENVRFDVNNREVWFTALNDGQRDLYRYDKAKKVLQQLRKENTGVQDFVRYKDQLIQILSSPENPYEIFQTTVKQQQQQHPKALTQINAQWLKQRQVLPLQKIKLKNQQGADLSFWLLKPAEQTAAGNTPLLVEIHGGPASYFGPDDASMWLEYQYFAAKGYAVLFGNPRGSTGYGTDFLKANYQDWGQGPAADVLAAVDAVIQQDITIDTANLFLTGGSYGGYLTTWILAHDQRFRAASSQRGVYDLSTFFGEGNVWPMVKRYFGGNPWEGNTARILSQNSVLDIAQQIQTPLLIFHGEQDLRTGIAQSERLYKTLKVLNRPVEYVRHPGANHEITRSGDVVQRIDQLLRTYEFFERYRGKP
ncbi:S9 family peptidase [Sphingobacterium sp. Mn56C]|uniref:S9 family peptidase n=1 Tax=Sphingobacterium sp. Mn56C TaxID=3395261 RepID=UPI003BEE1892